MSEDHLQVHEQKGQPHEAFVDLMVRTLLQDNYVRGRQDLLRLRRKIHSG